MAEKHLLEKCDIGVDWISSLPDDIIVRMLSFLPLKDVAASTCLVSKRWSHLWKYSPKITFRFTITSANLENTINQINMALKLHKAPSLQEFKIQFHINNYLNNYLNCDKHQLVKWLQYAFSRRVERLDLDLRAHHDLTDASIFIDIKMLKEIVGSNSSSSLKSLKVLCLRFCQVSGDDLGFFLRNCVSLERLVINRVARRSNLELVVPSLKHLDMRSRSVIRKYLYECNSKHPRFREDYYIKVTAPNLTWLTIDQSSKIVFLEHVPKLVNINFYWRFQFEDSMHHFANVAAQLVTLIVHLYVGSYKFPLLVPEMPRLKKLMIYFRVNYSGNPLVLTRFLSASPCLEEFKLEISELHGPRYPYFAVGPPCLHQHLKLFVLSGYCGVNSYHCCGVNTRAFGGLEVSLDLVRYMVDNCVGLEEIVVGQCDRVGLVRDMMDSYDPLEDVILEPEWYNHRHEATPKEKEAFRNLMQQQQIPSHIKLRVVFEGTIQH